jgi:transmembrane 9 superfamily protein 2/4
VYTYDIKWERSELRWSNRWDVYLKGNPDDEIHYFSIVNSLMIVLFLTGVVAMIMFRTLHKDISSYNEMQTLEEAQEESGWKLVHGDVFRPPAFSPMLLSVLAGEKDYPTNIRNRILHFVCDLSSPMDIFNFSPSFKHMVL